LLRQTEATRLSWQGIQQAEQTGEQGAPRNRPIQVLILDAFVCIESLPEASCEFFEVFRGQMAREQVKWVRGELQQLALRAEHLQARCGQAQSDSTDRQRHEREFTTASTSSGQS
jgi:hypothetical protein